MTLLEKAKEMGRATAGKCPCHQGLASTQSTLEFCKTHSCKECWGREYVEYKTKAPQSAKADAGKLELDLVPVQILRDIAQVRMYGNAKYGDPDNWKTVELRRYINALLRHLLAFLEEHDSKDEESGIEHYKHMACNMAFICHMMKG